MRRLLIAGTATCALGGCALLQPHPSPPPPKPPAVAHVTPRPTVRHAAQPTAPATGSAAAAARLHHPGAPPPPPVRVVGLSQDEVRRLLGAPSAETAEGPGRTWTYYGAGCAVTIDFFFDVTRNGFFALNQSSADGGDAAACLGGIHDSHVS